MDAQQIIALVLFAIAGAVLVLQRVLPAKTTLLIDVVLLVISAARVLTAFALLPKAPPTERASDSEESKRE